MSLPGSLTLSLDAPARRAERTVAAVALLVATGAPWLAFAPSAPGLVYGGCCVVIVAALLYRAGWLGRGQRLTGATWHADGRWTVIRDGRPPLDAELLGDSRIAAQGVWLRWRTREKPWPRCRSMLITASDLPPGQLRRLVVRLRLQGRSRPSVPGRPAA